MKGCSTSGSSARARSDTWVIVMDATGRGARGSGFPTVSMRHAPRPSVLPSSLHRSLAADAAGSHRPKRVTGDALPQERASQREKERTLGPVEPLPGTPFRYKRG